MVSADKVAVTTKRSSAYELRTAGTVWSRGSNDVGQLGNGALSNSAVPVPVSGLAGVQHLTTSGSDRNVFAVKTDGTVWAPRPQQSGSARERQYRRLSSACTNTIINSPDSTDSVNSVIEAPLWDVLPSAST
ncbi:hypothetical protein [Arthrobacter sp. MI7-26]|uniref:hypothetical protein n=1 Tax=Arthrobacter sp. MI7-26 TaxID=2993653 RepID=UPI003A5992F3